MENGRDTEGWDLELRVAARTGELPGIVDRIEAYAARAALPAGVAARLALVCEEWAANVVEHGSAGPDGATALRLSIRCSGAAVHVLAEDDGPPFNPLDAPAPDTAASLEQRGPGGLGLHLMRRVAREVRYERITSANRLALVLDIGA